MEWVRPNSVDKHKLLAEKISDIDFQLVLFTQHEMT